MSGNREVLLLLLRTDGTTAQPCVLLDFISIQPYDPQVNANKILEAIMMLGEWEWKESFGGTLPECGRWFAEKCSVLRHLRKKHI